MNLNNGILTDKQAQKFIKFVKDKTTVLNEVWSYPLDGPQAE